MLVSLIFVKNCINIVCDVFVLCSLCLFYNTVICIYLRNKLIYMNSEPQSGDAGAAIKLELRRTCDGVQMSTCVHITHHSQILWFWVPAQRRSLMHWLVNTSFGNIVHNIQYTFQKIKPFGGIMSLIRRRCSILKTTTQYTYVYTICE